MENLSYKSILMSLITTAEELNDLLDKLDKLSTLLGKIDTNFEPQIKQILDFDKFNAFITDFGNLHLKPNSQSDLGNYIEFIKKKIENLKVLKFTLAIDPSQELVDEIYYWIGKNIGENIILDLNTDKTIIAGGIVEFQGKFKDYSLKRKLDIFFAANPKLI
jgi:F0F1-type ATP synthase delta subunit